MQYISILSKCAYVDWTMYLENSPVFPVHWSVQRTVQYDVTHRLASSSALLAAENRGSVQYSCNFISLRRLPSFLSFSFFLLRI